MNMINIFVSYIVFDECTWNGDYSPDTGRDTFNEDPLTVSLSFLLIPIQPPIFLLHKKEKKNTKCGVCVCVMRSK